MVPRAKDGTVGKRWYLWQKTVPLAKDGTVGKRWYLGRKTAPLAKDGTVVQSYSSILLGIDQPSTAGVSVLTVNEEHYVGRVGGSGGLDATIGLLFGGIALSRSTAS